MLDIKELLNGKARRALHTTRYSTHTVHKVESVAHHTYVTMTYASVIAHSLEADGQKVNHGLVLNKALWHDVEEPSGVGDILRGVKHSSPQLAEMIEDLSSRYVSATSSDLGMYKIHEYWKNAKDQTLEGQIVRVADVFSVLAFLVEEFQLGNRTLSDVYEEVSVYLYDVIKEIENPDLQDLVREAQAYFKEMIEPCTITISK